MSCSVEACETPTAGRIIRIDVEIEGFMFENLYVPICEEHEGKLMSGWEKGLSIGRI